MSKTLYLTDLDGTLLNSVGQLSDYSRSTIAQFRQQNILFSCATGRTINSVSRLIKPDLFTCPGIFSDGLIIFDMLKQQLIANNGLDIEQIRNIEQILDQNGYDGFLYALQNQQYHLIHKAIKYSTGLNFRQQKTAHFSDNDITQLTSFTSLSTQIFPLYFVIYDSLQRLQSLVKILTTMDDIHCIYNKDIYQSGDYYFLNILPSAYSKASGVLALKSLLKADEVVVFGDNWNDLAMLKIADRAYVPENAISEAKAIATAIIDSHKHDGVIRFIEQDIKNKQTN